MIFKRIVPD